MKVNSDFNPQSSTVVLTVESNLIEKYFANLRGMILECKRVSGLEVNQSSGNTATISFPLPKDSEKRKVNETTMMLSLNGNDMNELNDIIKKFANVAISKELKSVEFIPLDGYSPAKMSEEILDTVDKKRDILFIKDFSEYLKMKSSKEYKFNQYRLNYGTPEYADAVLLIWKKQRPKLKKLYQDKLVYTDWL